MEQSLQMLKFKIKNFKLVLVYNFILLSAVGDVK